MYNFILRILNPLKNLIISKWFEMAINLALNSPILKIQWENKATLQLYFYLKLAFIFFISLVYMDLIC